MKEFRLQKYRDIGDIITDTFTYIRLHYKSLGKGLLYFVLPFYLVSAVLVGNAYSSFFEVTMSSTSPEEIGFGFFGADFWIGLLLTMLASGSIFTITLKHIQLTQTHDEIEAMQLVQNFGRNFLTLLLLYIMVVVSVFFGLFFFIIPGIFLGVKFFISPAAAILENRRNPFEALTRSWNLTQDYWWVSFGTYLVLYLITTMMSYVLVIPFSIIIGIFTATGADASGGLSSAMGVFYGLMVVLASLFSVILIIGMALHYFNLIERKEGTGLRSQIEEL